MCCTDPVACNICFLTCFSDKPACFVRFPSVFPTNICTFCFGSREVCVVQVRHFAAHYAGDEGLARPFSAMPSDRNLAWSDQPCGLPSPDRPAARLRPDAHSRDQPPATSPTARQVSSQELYSYMYVFLVRINSAEACDGVLMLTRVGMISVTVLLAQPAAVKGLSL